MRYVAVTRIGVKEAPMADKKNDCASRDNLPKKPLPSIAAPLIAPNENI